MVALDDCKGIISYQLQYYKYFSYSVMSVY